ncbi:MAG: hypothetical protein ACOX8U_11355 [Bradymonadia bacterium]
MRKTFAFIFCVATLSACVNSGGSSNQTNDRESSKLVGYSEIAWTLREIVIPAGEGSLSVRCYLNDYAKKVCKGKFTNGEVASSEQVQAALGVLQIDPRIDNALKLGCDNKTLLLAVEPKIVIPDRDESEFCFFSHESNTITSCNGKVVSLAEAEAINNKRLEQLKLDILEARKIGLDKFIELNPNLVSAERAQDYYGALYGSLNIKIDACDWQSFINKNRDILDIVALRALVNDSAQISCKESVEYKVLLKADNYSVNSKPSPYYKILSSKDDLAPLTALGLDDTVINSVDFVKDFVLYLSGGEQPTIAYSLQIDDICIDSKVEVHITHCAGQDEGEALSEPIMLIQLPKNDYDIEFNERELVCE